MKTIVRTIVCIHVLRVMVTVLHAKTELGDFFATRPAIAITVKAVTKKMAIVIFARMDGGVSHAKSAAMPPAVLFLLVTNIRVIVQSVLITTGAISVITRVI